MPSCTWKSNNQLSISLQQHRTISISLRLNRTISSSLRLNRTISTSSRQKRTIASFCDKIGQSAPSGRAVFPSEALPILSYSQFVDENARSRSERQDGARATKVVPADNQWRGGRADYRTRTSSAPLSLCRGIDRKKPPIGCALTTPSTTLCQDHFLLMSSQSIWKGIWFSVYGILYVLSYCTVVDCQSAFNRFYRF